MSDKRQQQNSKTNDSSGNSIGKPTSSTLETMRLPPAAKELEAAILGTIQTNRDAIDTVMGILTPAAFYVDSHRRIFEAMSELNARSQPVDGASVVNRMTERGELELVGGPYGIFKLQDGVVNDTSLEHHCRVVLERYLQREMGRVGVEMHNRSYNLGGDVFEMLDESERDVLGIANHIQNDVFEMDSSLVATMKQIEEWRSLNKLITGIPSGMPTLDKMTRGFQPGDLIILAARPSVGKTAAALSFARAAAGAGFPVGVFSLEMTRIQLTLRLIASEGEINLHRLQIGRLDDEQMKAMHRDAISPLSKMRILIDDNPDTTIGRIRSSARRMVKRHGVKMLIVDYLQLVSGVGHSREQEISSISRGLKKLGKELSIPVVALSQLSREIEKRTGARKVPQLADLRESGAIEQDADTVILLWAPDEDDIARDPSLAGRRWARIAKQRSGSLGQIAIDFYGDTQVMREHRDEETAAKALAPSFKPVSDLFQNPYKD